MSQSDWYLKRFAIKCPDGSLAHTAQDTVWMWDNVEAAERALGYFAGYAAKLGVHNWEGEIVHQLCTPWLGEHDNANAMLADLAAWLEQQIGGES